MIEIKIETDLSGRPNPPWQADGVPQPPEAGPAAAEVKERTVFGLAGELKNLVREDRMYRSEQARRLIRAKKSP